MELTEVADMCGISLATVKRRLAKAQKRFIEFAQSEPELAEWIDRGVRWKK
jgi:RNA polymerase sigma-70 factor (ECF subfamily)